MSFLIVYDFEISLLSQHLSHFQQKLSMMQNVFQKKLIEHSQFHDCQTSLRERDHVMLSHDSFILEVKTSQDDLLIDLSISAVLKNLFNDNALSVSAHFLSTF